MTPEDVDRLHAEAIERGYPAERLEQLRANAPSRPETVPPASPEDLKGLPIEEAARLLRERHPDWWFVDGGPQSPWFACPRNPSDLRRGVVAYTAATLSRRITEQDQ